MSEATPMKFGKMGNQFIAINDHETPLDKIVRDRIDEHITVRQVQSMRCWGHPDESLECSVSPRVWVREIRYDLGEGDEPMQSKTAVGTEHLAGWPQPGFCWKHLLKDSPARLASLTYFSHPMMQWGFRPSRFFVIFTDGTTQGGPCIWINPHPEIMPTVTDTHVRAHNG